MTASSAPYRIAMFCPQYYPRIGGAERQAEKLARALVRSGHAVTILTPRIERESLGRETVAGVDIERLDIVDLSMRYPVRGVALANVPAMLWQIARAVGERLAFFDVLHCHIGSVQTVGAVLAARIAGTPVLCKAAMAAEHSDLGEIENTGPSGRVVARLARAVIPRWVATTHAVTEALIRARVPTSRIVEIPNGVDLSPHTVRPPRPIRRFLYLGRLSTNIDRDVPSLVTAFDRVASQRDDIELAIVGDGDLLEDTRARVAACAQRDRIAVPGFGSAAEWLAWADCFVLPSRREGLSNALLEAMAAGIPCIATDIGPNREVLDDGHVGRLVPVEDPASLAVALDEAITAPEIYARYAEAGFQRARREYSIDGVAARYVELYGQLCAGARRARAARRSRT